MENPGPGSRQSGIGLLSGWVCDAEVVELEIDGINATHRLEAAYGTDRADTVGICGDTDNGFGLLFNWNLLLLNADPPRDDDVFTVRALANGVEFGRATFTVTTLGCRISPGCHRRYGCRGLPHRRRRGPAGVAAGQPELRPVTPGRGTGADRTVTRPRLREPFMGLQSCGFGPGGLSGGMQGRFLTRFVGLAALSADSQTAGCGRQSSSPVRPPR